VQQFVLIQEISNNLMTRFKRSQRQPAMQVFQSASASMLVRSILVSLQSTAKQLQRLWLSQRSGRLDSLKSMASAILRFQSSIMIP